MNRFEFVPLNQRLKPLNDLLEPLIKMGFGAPPNLNAGMLVVETKGRITGRSLTLPLLGYLAYPYLVIGTVRPASQWMKNLHADDNPHVWLWGRRFRLQKRFVADHVVAGTIVL